MPKLQRQHRRQFQELIVSAPTTGHATLNRGAISKCGLFSSTKGWSDDRAAKFPNQRFPVPEHKALTAAASIARFYDDLGAKRPAMRLSPVFTEEKPWTPSRDLGRKPLREVKGLTRPPLGTKLH